MSNQHPELAVIATVGKADVFVGNFKGSEFPGLKEHYASARQGNNAYEDAEFTRLLPLVRTSGGVDVQETLYPCFMDKHDADRYSAKELATTG